MRARSALPGMLAAAIAAGCASGPVQEPAAESAPLSVEEILAAAPRAEDYGQSTRCLSTNAYMNVDVLDNQTLVFRGRGGRAWLNRLRRPCIGLRRDDALRFELHENRLCSLDSFTGIDAFMGSLERGSAICSLGEFETISREQAAALKEALRP